MSITDPEPGEPGYTIDKLRKADTDQEFVEAYRAHRDEMEKKHKHTVRPYDALCSRVIEHFGQYSYGGEEDPRRNDALWLLREVQRYLALSADGGGMNASSAVKRRTLAEFEADIAYVAISVLGCERSNMAFGSAFPAERASPTSRRLVLALDLGCTEMDDHDPAPCPKCEGIREQLGKVVDSALAEQYTLECQSRNAGHVLHTFGSGMTEEDLKKTAADGLMRGAKAELELRSRKKEREEAAGDIGEDEGEEDEDETTSETTSFPKADQAEAEEPKGITREELMRDYSEIVRENGILCMVKRKSDGKEVSFRMGKQTVYFEPIEQS